LIKALQGEQREAFRYFTKSLDQFEAAGEKVGMARMLANIGNTRYVEGNFADAIDHYQKSLTLREAMNDVTAQANLFVGLGTAYLAQKEFAQARNEFQKAAAIFERLGKTDQLAETQAKLAEVSLNQSDYQQALKEADVSNNIAAGIAANSTLWYGHLIAGKAYRGMNQDDSAAKEFGECITSIESSSLSSMSEAGSQRSNLLPYVANIEMLVDENRPGEAFELTERARVQAHRDLLGKSVARIQKSLSTGEVANESNLLREVTALALQLDLEGQRRSANPAATEALRKRLQQAQNNYEKFRRSLYVAHPQLKVLRGEMSPLKFDEARNLVGDAQTALLEYLVTESNVYLFVLSLERRDEGLADAGESKAKKNGPIVYLKVYPLNITPNDLSSRIAQVRQSMISRDNTFKQPARELYDLLIKPAEPQVKNKTSLVIVPDGLLWRVPFEVLQPAADVFLVDRFTTTYASSLTALREMKKLTTTRALTFPQKQREKSDRKKTSGQLAFAAPRLSDELLLRLSLLGIQGRVESAADNKKDTSNSMASSNSPRSRVYKDVDASEERIKLESGSYDVVYFDAPANLDDASPMYSFVALASREPGADDGLLHSWEIANLKSQSRLVVLSGSTASNERPISGAAVSSLAWSWFVAGTPSTLLTRWQLPSPSKGSLWSDISKHFQAGPRSCSISLADTIHQSVLSLRHSTNYSHPYYWSGFMLMGAP
jgi:CHAT domain-containing protein